MKMKKSLPMVAFLAIVLAVVGIVAALGGSTSFVGFLSANADSATVETVPCSILLPGGDQADNGQGHLVGTQSAQGNIELVCHVSGIPNSTGQAIFLNNVRCFALGKTTIESHTVVSASGETILTCHFKT
jgi:ABC-type enterochelin transport system permease subunit